MIRNLFEMNNPNLKKFVKISAAAVAVGFCAKELCLQHPFLISRIYPVKQVPWDVRVAKRGDIAYFLYDPIQKCAAKYAEVDSMYLYIETCQDNGVLKPSLKELVRANEPRE